MTFQGDPYRTLGLVAGASLNEIRSAYRRLVKQHHPDAAGERALPRFLAIQAAYERLVDADGRLRPGGERPAGGPPSPGSGPREPWRADPARARASRDAWRARRGAGSGGTSSSSAGARDGARDPGEGGGRQRSAGSAGAGPSGSAAGGTRSDGSPRERHARRGPRKATPGSTTYDEAAEIPRDPAWAGGSWYGPSSGTYWTINPREYADPRKHGPEYQERARRANRGTAGPDPGAAGDALPGPAPRPAPETEGAGQDARWRWAGAGSTATGGGAAEWGTGPWTYDATSSGIDPAPEPSPATTGDATGDASHTAAVAPIPGLETFARRVSPRNLLTLAGRPDRRWRLLLTLAGWPPIGWMVGTWLSTSTGCATFSTACPEPISLLPLIVQPFVVAGLFLAAPVAAVAAFASLVALAVAVPVAAVLSAGTLPGSRPEAWVLGAVVAIAWLFALVTGGVAVAAERADPGDAPPGP